MYRFGALRPGEYTVVVPSTNTTMPTGTGMGAVAAARAFPATEFVNLNGGLDSTMSRVTFFDGNVEVDGQQLTTGIPVAPARERGQPWAFRTTFYPNALRSSQATSMTVRSGDEIAGIDFDLMPIRTLTLSGVVTSGGVPVPRADVQLLRAAESPSGR